MNSSLAGILQIVLLVLALAVFYKPLGDYIARIFTSEKHTRPERALYRARREELLKLMKEPNAR